jgi:3'-phosphoadenosine 5'-phosphosulfate sulfotransferase (PAPS reductase)/FAD synthetase
MEAIEFSTAHKWVFVSFSGGKDSTAAFLEARKQYPIHIIQLIFTDTGYEHPETYDYLRWFDKHVHPIKRLASRIISEKNGRRYFENVVIDWERPVEWVRENCHTVLDELYDRHQRYPNVPPFPSGNARHCTKTVKVRVFERHIRSVVPLRERHLAVQVIGVRRSESRNRSDTPETATDSDTGCDVWYPIVDYSKLDTFRAMRKAGIPANEVYRYSPRSNCVWCPFASMKTIKETEKRHPGIMDEMKDFEKETGWLWHQNEAIGDSCTSGFCEM